MNQGEKIRVLHIIKSLGRGGAEMLLPETLKLHNQEGFEFHYVYFLPWKNQMVEALEKAGGKVTCVPASNNFQILGRRQEVISYIKDNHINIIHCHLPWAGILGRILFRSAGIPVLYTEHNKQERYHWITRWMNRLTFNWQTMAIAVSTDVEESIQRHIHPRIPVKVVQNGVNTTIYSRNREAGEAVRSTCGIPSGAVVVGTVAVFRTQKRLKEWLDVFHRAATSNPNLYGILVGDGPMCEEITAHRKDLGLDNRVKMPGLKSEIVPWLSAMDIFMMTTQFEGMPVALLEAMSTQCAVITTDAGGIKEVVRSNIDGIMVSVNQPMDLVQHLIRLGENSAERNRLAIASRIRVEMDFDLRRMVGALEKVYLSPI